MVEQKFRRAAEVFQVAAGPDEGWWRIRLRRYPDEGGWIGGKVLWGHDQDEREDAVEIAQAWILDGVMPEINLAWPLPPALPLEVRRAKIKAEFRSAVAGLCLQTHLTDEEFWVQEQDLALEALGDLSRLKRAKGVS